MRRRRLLAIVAAFGLIIAACGDDDDDTTTDPTEDTDGGSTDEDGEGEDDGTDDEGEALTVTAVDYAYEDLPATVAAGTTISLANASAAELHEFVAIRLPDDETRSVDELFQLPQEELEPLLGPGVTDVVISVPGATDQPGAVEGDAVLDEPGRYAIACFIPTGIDPQAYLQAAQEAEGGPPEVEGGGPPHFVQGMYAELTVE